MSDKVTPPDVARATGELPIPDLTGLLAMAQKLQSQPLITDPWQAIGAGLSGIASGYQGKPNPILTLLTEEREKAHKTVADMIQLQLKSEELRQKTLDRQFEKSKALMDVYKGLASVEDPRVQEYGIQGMLNQLPAFGVPPSPGRPGTGMGPTGTPGAGAGMGGVGSVVPTGLLAGRIRPKDLPDLVKMIDNDFPLWLIQRTYPQISDEDFNVLRQSKEHPGFRKWAGAPTKEEIQQQQLVNQEREQKILFEEYGIADADMGSAIRKMAISMYGKPFAKLTLPERRKVINAFDIPLGGTKLSDTSSLRGQYEQGSQTWAEVGFAFGRIQRVVQGTPTHQKDIALLVGYMKMIDPKTGVKEGELAVAERAGTVPQWLLGFYNRLWANKGMLSTEQRIGFTRAAFEQFDVHRTRQLEREKEYQGIAIRSKMDPRDAVPDLLGGLRGLSQPLITVRVRSKTQLDPRTGKPREGNLALGPTTPIPPDVEIIE